MYCARKTPLMNWPDDTRERGRANFKTNMADLQSVELIEFFRPYKNEVNLYVTNISRRLEKEMVEVSVSSKSLDMSCAGNKGVAHYFINSILLF